MKASLLLACLLVLVACSSPLSTPAPPSTPQAAASTTALRPTPRPPTASAQRPPTPQPSPQPPGQLLLWAAASDSELVLLRQFAAEWSQRSGRTLRVEGKSADAIRAALLIPSLKAAAPQLIWGDEQDLVALSTDGQLQPVGEPPAPLLAAADATAQHDGQRWGLAICAKDALLLFYNRRLLPAAPGTTDELISLAREQTRDGRYGLVYNWADARWLLPWLNAFSEAGSDGTAPALDGPAMEQALSLLQELRSAGPPPPSTYEEGVALFRAGQVAMTIDGDWAAAGYQGAPDTVDLGVAPLPVAAATGRRAATPIGASYLMFQSSLAAADLPAARDFAAFLLSPAAQTRLAALERLPASQAALGDPEVQASPLLSALAQEAEAATPAPTTAAQRCAWSAISSALPALLLGQSDRPATIAAMQAAQQRCAS